MDPYRILGIIPGATNEEIRRAYRKMAVQHHPDAGGDAAVFQQVQEAYEALTTEKPVTEIPKAQPETPPPTEASKDIPVDPIRPQQPFEDPIYSGTGFGPTPKARPKAQRRKVPPKKRKKRRVRNANDQFIKLAIMTLIALILFTSLAVGAMYAIKQGTFDNFFGGSNASASDTENPGQQQAPVEDNSDTNQQNQPPFRRRPQRPDGMASRPPRHNGNSAANTGGSNEDETDATNNPFSKYPSGFHQRMFSAGYPGFRVMPGDRFNIRRGESIQINVLDANTLRQYESITIALPSVVKNNGPKLVGGDLSWTPNANVPIGLYEFRLEKIRSRPNIQNVIVIQQTSVLINVMK